MCCSREQLLAILSHHQVMPSFLDFCFEFKKRESALKTSLFRVEDSLNEQMDEGGWPDSDMRIQHMFNIHAFEDNKEAKEEYRWPLRHITVYHSFNVVDGTSLWFIIKGDNAMRERVTASPKYGCDGAGASDRSPAASLKAALRAHIPILEWCTENWSSYIGYLEAKYLRYASNIKHAPVSELAASMANRATAGTAPKATIDNKSLRRGTHNSHASRIRGILSSRRNTATSSVHYPAQTGEISLVEEPEHIDSEDEDEVNGLFPFDDLQDIRRLSDDVATANLILDQNKRILGHLRERYSNLAKSRDFGGLIALDSSRAAIAEFLQQVEVLEGDLDAQRCQVIALARSLEKTEEMVRIRIAFPNTVNWTFLITGLSSSKVFSSTSICGRLNSLPKLRRSLPGRCRACPNRHTKSRPKQSGKRFQCTSLPS